ncbi:MAG: Fic family protein [bacterium]|nr:Fic family protein [bacterium]
MDILNRIDELQQKIKPLRPFSKEMKNQLRQFYRIGLTYSSNAVEGNSLTLSETKVVLEDGITVGGKPLKDHLEAVGHSRAFDLMWQLAATGNNALFNESDIKNLHSHLFQPLNPDVAGIYRKAVIMVTGSSYTFPAPAEIPTSMKEYVTELPGIKEKSHPVVYASEVHANLVRIHPFSDGNGRIARLLMNLVLFASGYPVTIIPPLRRVEYINALEKSHLTGDNSSFVRLIASCVKESQKELLRLFHA